MSRGPIGAGRRIHILIEALGHLAVWVGLYMAGAVALVIHVAMPPRSVSAAATALAAAIMTGIGVYLLDRVKLRDRWLDPADLTGHQRRFGFLVSVLPRVRGLALMNLIGGTLAAWLTHPALVLAPALAAAGVLVYAGRPSSRGKRVKDQLIVKNAAVAVAITGFAVVLAAGAATAPEESLAPGVRSALGPIAVAAAYLVLRVFSDAVACDIDDVESDRHFGTRTLPVVLGVRRARIVGLVIRGVAIALLLLAPVGAWDGRVAWAIATAVTTLMTLAAGVVSLRDLVDLRLAADAVIAAAIIGVGVFA